VSKELKNCLVELTETSLKFTRKLIRDASNSTWLTKLDVTKVGYTFELKLSKYINM